MKTYSLKLFRPLFCFSCLALAFVALTVQSCSSPAEANGGDRKAYIIPDSLLKLMKIDSVKAGPMTNSLTLTGQVDFNQDSVINIYPMISGVVEEIKVVLGDYVKAGQVLGIIKSAEMSQFSSDLLNAQTNLRVATMNLEKTKDMYRSGLASKTDSLSAAVTEQQAKAELIRVQRVLKINGDNTQGEYIIKAPINGFIVQKMVNNNQSIRGDNGGPLFTISDLKDVWIWANVYESNAGNIHQDDNVDVSTLSYPDRIFKGKVNKIMQVLDPASKAMKVRISIANPDYVLKPQMFASVTITNTKSESALYVPTSSMIFDNSRYYVLLYRGKGRADITSVQKVSTLGKRTYLSEGVKLNDRVIASDALQIYSELNN